MKARIYGVEFEGKIIYVGVTKQSNILLRFAAHKSAAKTKMPGFSKLGEWLLTDPLYSIKILEYVDLDVRFKREAFWINHYKTIENGFNRPAYKGGANNPCRGAPGRPKGCSNPSGSDHYASTKIKCKKTGRIFGSMGEAARASNVSVATVCLHANNKRTNPRFCFVVEKK
jgi:hypothetical protein